MEEIIDRVCMALRGMWQWRWWGVAAAWAVALVGAALVMRIEDHYAVRARVFVDTRTVLKPLLSGLAIQLDADQQVAMLARTLITRPNLEAMVDQMDGQLQLSGESRDEFIGRLSRYIKISSASGRENLFNIAYTDTDPERGQRVVTNLVELFMHSDKGHKQNDAHEAARIINEQIKIYEERLSEAENRLKDFKLKNAGFISTSNQDYFGRTNAATEQVAQLRTELRAAEQSKEAIERELLGEDPVLLSATPTNSSSVNPLLQTRIDTVSQQLDELQRRFTDEHPDVIAAKELLASLQAEREQQLAALRKAARGGRISAASNPVFQQLKVALTEAQARVASLRSRLHDAQLDLSKLRLASDRVPQVEAEMAQLNRDYDVLRAKYQELVGRRETAQLSSRVDASAQLGQFRLIDPPSVSARPVFPNRVSMLGLVLLAAVAFGVGVTFAASQLAPRVFGLRQLRELTQRPVLGAVSMQLSVASLRQQRRDGLLMAGALSALVLLYAAGAAWAAYVSGV